MTSQPLMLSKGRPRVRAGSYPRTWPEARANEGSLSRPKGSGRIGVSHQHGGGVLERAPSRPVSPGPAPEAGCLKSDSGGYTLCGATRKRDWPRRCAVTRVEFRTAFTLIELLVVVSIISLLAAILFPVFGVAREKARQASCASNLRQLGAGFLQYNEDYDGNWPCGVDFASPPNSNRDGNGNYTGLDQGRGWGGEIYPYIRNPQVLTCPDDTFVPPGGYFIDSYGYNSAIPFTVDPCYETVKPHLSEASWTQPGSTVVLFEIANWQTAGWEFPGTGSQPDVLSLGSNGYTSWSYWDDDYWSGTDHEYATGPLGSTPAVAKVGVDYGFTAASGRHTGGSNYLFGDGHVKWAVGTAISPGYANEACSNWYTPTTGGAVAGPKGIQSSNESAPYWAAGTQNPNFQGTFSPI